MGLSIAGGPVSKMLLMILYGTFLVCIVFISVTVLEESPCTRGFSGIPFYKSLSLFLPSTIDNNTLYINSKTQHPVEHGLWKVSVFLFVLVLGPHWLSCGAEGLSQLYSVW